MTLYAQWDHNFGYYDQLLLSTMRTKEIEYIMLFYRNNNSPIYYISYSTLYQKIENCYYMMYMALFENN